MNKRHLLNLVLRRFDTQLSDQIYTDQHFESDYRSEKGAYYTPVTVVLQMVCDTLESLLVSRLETEDAEVDKFISGELEYKRANQFLKLISELSWLDMASGTGVFALVYLEVLRVLCHHYRTSEALLATTAKNMYINDQNGDVVAAFKALCPYPVNCLVTDALIGLVEDNRIGQVVESGGFDIIIGNPPYVGERGNRELFEGYKQNNDLSPYYVARMDLFYFFLHRGINLLKDTGCLCQITTHYFTTADGGWRLREHLKKSIAFTHLRLQRECDVFSGVKQLSVMSFTGIKTENKSIAAKCYDRLEWLGDSDRIAPIVKTQASLYDKHGQMIVETTPEVDCIVDYLLSRDHYELSAIVQVNQGVVTGMDRAKCEEGTKPVFVYEEAELPVDYCQKLFRPFIKNGMIKPFQLNQSRNLFLMYTDAVTMDDYPEALQALMPYKERLKLRREVKNGVRQWYQLQWGRSPKLFEQRKIVAPQRATRNTFCYVEAPSYASADVYFLSSESGDPVFLQGLAAYLNSSVAHSWLYQHGKRKGNLLELYATPLKRIPVPKFSDAEYGVLAQFYVEISSGVKPIEQGERELHNWLCRYLEIPDHATDALWQWHIVSIQT